MISLCCNKVPKYLQEDDLPDHVTERDDLNDNTLRHPEVNENYSFLDIGQEEYDGQRYDLVQKLRDAGLVINSLNNLYF